MTSRKRKKNEGVHELTSLEVREVSLVDRPANGRRFSMVKNEDGTDMDEERIEIDLTKGTPVETTETDENLPEDLGSVFKSLGATLGSEEVEKALAVSDEVKAAAYKAMSNAMRRIDTAMMTMRMSDTTEDETPTDFSKMLGAELLEVSSIIASMGKKLGGSKAAKTKKNDESEVESPEDFKAALSSLETRLEDLVKEETKTVEKAGAKMARGRLKAFETALGQLSKLLDELKGTQFKEKTAKADTDDRDERIATLEKSLEESKSKVAKQAAELKKLHNARGRSGALTVEKGEGFGDEGGDVSWPQDLNRDPALRKIDKAVDFR